MDATPNGHAGNLPEWDLSDLYTSPDAPELDADLRDATVAVAAFHDAHAGHVAEKTGADLAKAVAEYERIQEMLGRVLAYAYLRYAADVADAARGIFLQDMQEKTNAIGTQILFFTLEINRLAEDALAEKLRTPALAAYGPWLRDVRVFRDHQLSDDLEKMLHEKQLSGRAAWTRLFDETMAALRFDVDGKELTETEVLDLLTSPDGGLRKKAAKALGKVFSENARLFALITNTLAKDKAIEDVWRKFARPVSSQNLENHVSDDVVAALATTVRNACPQLSHRYYAWKARLFGVPALDYWDRNAPLPDQETRPIPWTEAVATVLEAYGDFSPEMASLGQRFFDAPWIDAGPRPGKASGAFAHPTVPSHHPYLLLNYQEKPRDVMTLAHELGHGVHQLLAGPQGLLLSDTPLTLAETASVFGEMLTFRCLLAKETDRLRRRNLIAMKVEDMLNTVVRQIAFHTFEERVHDERRGGELSVARLSDIWMEVQRESLGPAIRFDEGYRCYWTYIPHFIHSPFYVYAYAFGDCLVNSLYAVYESGEAGFVPKYFDLLRAGGTQWHGELLAPFGLDASDPAFWERGLGVISGLIDDLESLS
ncbi:M3 family oligoendopeptidase [Rhodospirillaceae bacterium AH-315-P19]|nr:M3 family oligoendopeptidase [Rhodospirillaceae bacterium AH-315-P19]